MPARVVWEGLADWKIDLARLPADLTREAEPLIRAATLGAVTRIRAGYPVGKTGNLRAGVISRVEFTGPFGVVGKVRNRAPHSHLYEKGTKKRRTRKGYNRGSMPGHRILIPLMIQARGTLDAQLAALLAKYGLVVAYAA